MQRCVRLPTKVNSTRYIPTVGILAQAPHGVSTLHNRDLSTKQRRSSTSSIDWCAGGKGGRGAGGRTGATLKRTLSSSTRKPTPTCGVATLTSTGRHRLIHATWATACADVPYRRGRSLSATLLSLITVGHPSLVVSVGSARAVLDAFETSRSPEDPSASS